MKTVTVNGVEFQITRMPAMLAVRLDRRVLTMVAPVLGGLEGISLKSTLDMGKLARGVQEALETLSDTEFEALLLELFRYVKALPIGSAPIELTSPAEVDKAFKGLPAMAMYQLAFEVMRHNEFTPFALASTGQLTLSTGGLSVGAKSNDASKMF